MLNITRRSTQTIIIKTSSSYKTIRMASSNDQKPASMLGGHAQYAKGYVAETVGNMMGSKEWQESGQKTAKAGIDEMRVCCFPSLNCFAKYIYIYICCSGAYPREWWLMWWTTGSERTKSNRAWSEWAGWKDAAGCWQGGRVWGNERGWGREAK